MLYPCFHRIVDDEVWLNVNTSLALGFFSHVVHDKTLTLIYLWRFFGRKEANEIRRWAEDRYRRDEEHLNRMGVSNEVETESDEESE